MPNIKDKSTVEAIAQAFTSNGRNRAQAMEEVGYAHSYAYCGLGQDTIYKNIQVIDAIARLDAVGAQENERTVQSLDELYAQAYDLAAHTRQPSAMVSAVTGIARLYGMDKDAGKSSTVIAPLLPPDQQQELEAIGRTFKLRLANSQDKAKEGA